ncbi:unnamed protein product [Orchesella dallaii]|uniref:Uncharacterized protein n=1 Tax=Orchesella dallaii TaxID=48710 RepID=A0ABP1RVF4_9HEXA
MTISAIQKAEIDRSAQLLNIAMIERRLADQGTRPVTKGLAQSQIDSAQKVKDALLDIHTRIVVQTLTPAEKTAHEKEYMDLMDRVEIAIGAYRDIINDLSPTATTSSTASHPAHPPPRPPQSLKLPEIKLPTFCGKITKIHGIKPEATLLGLLIAACARRVIIYFNVSSYIKCRLHSAWQQYGRQLRVPTAYVRVITQLSAPVNTPAKCATKNITPFSIQLHQVEARIRLVDLLPHQEM